jgi:hypothetical protein
MSSTHIAIQGAGAVSSAGWGIQALKAAVMGNLVIPCVESQREGTHAPVETRPVPKPETSLAFLRNPRLRRCSPITRFAVAASLEALGEERMLQLKEGSYRLGMIFTFMNGCVNYSNRFYGEVLSDPTFASPILFPETVFNAPASHLAAMLESRGPAYTLVGDSAQFLAGMDLGIEWLLDERVDGVIIVGGEELDWLSTEAVALFSHELVTSEGAGAVLLERTDEKQSPTVQCITPAYMYAAGLTKHDAMQSVRDGLPEASEHAVRILHRFTEDTPALDPHQVIGDTLGAALALQCALAYALLEEDYENAHVLHAGANQQAIGAWFTR